MRVYNRSSNAIRRFTSVISGITTITEDIIVDGNVNIFTKDEIVKHPNWAARKNQPSLYVPPSNYDHSSERLKNYHGFAYRPQPGGMWYYSGSLASVVSHAVTLPTLIPIGYIREKAIISALKKLKGQHVNLALAYAEKEKTAAMVLSTAKSLRGSIKALKRGDLKGAANALRVPNRGPSKIKPPKEADVPQRWLELQYGWKPLLSDVHGSARALADLVANDSTSMRVTVKGYAKDETLSHATINGNADYSIFTKNRRTCGVRLDYHPPSASGLMQAASLGLTNPFDLAWELIPFSFMVDWFLPIGDILNVMDAALPFDFLGGYITELVEADQQNLATHSYSTPWRITAAGEAYRHMSRRQSLSSSPFPSFAFELPKSPSNANVASALSIVAATFGK